MTRYQKRIRITLVLLISLFFMIMVLSIIDFSKGSYVPQLHQLVFDEDWILTIIAVIGLYVSVWLIHDFMSEHKEKKQRAKRKADIISSEDESIIKDMKRKNKH